MVALRDVVGVLVPQGPAPDIGAYEYEKEAMTIISALQQIEADLRQEAVDLVALADRIAREITNLQVIDDALDVAADIIEAD